MKIFAFLVACALSTAAKAEPSGISANYDVYMQGIKVGHMQEVFRRSKNRYEISSTTEPAGLLAALKPGKIITTSRGSIGKNGLRPESYDHVRENDAGRNAHAELDWRAKRITLTHQGEKQQLALPYGTQDRLSAMYQFMFLHLEKLSRLEFTMTDGKKLDSYSYAVAPNQKTETVAGTCAGFYLDNQAKPGESRNRIWVSEKNLLPCKMIITDSRGQEVTQSLSSLSIAP
jgi:hypothetical protein